MDGQKRRTEAADSRKGRNKKKRGIRQRVASVLGLTGTLLLVLLVLACLPLTVPRLFGYHIYSVVSGSMEPAIPTGSLVYIGEADPEEMEEERSSHSTGRRILRPSSPTGWWRTGP